MKKKALRAGVRDQYGAVPYRRKVDGSVEILLVTSRDTGRWIIPKGWPIKKLGPLGTAMQEAFEEAGVRGDGGSAVGVFKYLKVMKNGRDQFCAVSVFPLLVREELNDWPEMAERVRRWFSPADASAAVVEEGLGKILGDGANWLSLSAVDRAHRHLHPSAKTVEISLFFPLSYSCPHCHRCVTQAK